jgi:primary-amine oxidase
VDEVRVARDVVLSAHSSKEVVVDFREIFLQEPPKELMKQYLEAEHAATPGRSPVTPPRLAKCQYDVIGSDKVPEYQESIVDIGLKKRVKHEVIGKEHQASLTLWEFDTLVGRWSQHTFLRPVPYVELQSLAGGRSCSRTLLPSSSFLTDSKQS